MKIGKRVKEEIQHHFRAAHQASTGSLAKRIALWSFTGILAAGVGGLFLFTIIIAFFSIGLPDVRDFDKLAGSESTILYDREGGILHTIHGEENRKYVPLSEISPFVQKATIAIEDDEFYEHNGFDIPAIARAVLYEFFGIGRQRGGSTITQQLARNAFLTRERSLVRKIKEIILAIRLERAYDKDKILELYLNRIPYGNNAYGTELAAKVYFNKTARELTLAESVILASLPNAPSFYSPYGSNVYSKLEREFNNEKDTANLPTSILDLEEEDYTVGLIGKKITLSPENSVYIHGRTDLVLKRMEELGFIEAPEKKQALAQMQETEFRRYPQLTRAQHFIFEIRSQLEEVLGGKEFVAQGGFRVYTTLDPKLQDAAEKILRDQIAISKEQHGVSNAALFSINAKTGEVLSMVGAADYFDLEARGNVNHVFAKRQPGSSFKPIVYAKAFLNRYAPATVIYDTPTNFGGNYAPQNFEGGFRGPMTIRQALGQSRNIPAIKAYFMAGQQDEIIQLANKMGIDTLKLGADYGPAMAIGAGEVTLAEMVQAFSVFANNGIKHNIYSITKIVDRDGDVIYERKAEDDKKEEVLDPQVAYLINSILSDKSVYLGPRLNVAGHTTAAKTGTSNKEISPTQILPSNLWTLGYTPSVVTGVWAGNSLGEATKVNADGYNIAAPMWAKFMAAALEGTPDEAFPKPEGIKTVTVSKASGKLPSPSTPKGAQISDVFASFSVPTEVDDIYAQAQVNKLDNKLPNEFTPVEYVEEKVFMNHHDPITDFPRWLEGIRTWVKKTREANPDFPDFPPTETTTIFSAETAKRVPTVHILSPAPFSTFTQRGDIAVDVDIDAPYGVDRVLFFFDDRKIASTIRREKPFSGTVAIPKNAEAGSHFITVKLYDKIGYVAQAKIEIKFAPVGE